MMSSDMTLRGQVQRGYTIQATPDVCYEYLSDVRTLLTQVPYVEKIQVGKQSGRARAFFSITVMGIAFDAILDMEPVRDPENRVIKIKSAEQPLGPIPPGYFTGLFNSYVKVTPAENGKSRVSSQVILAFDGKQLVQRGLFPASLIEISGSALLQEYCEKLCDEYILNLLENFKKWHAARGE